MNIVEKIEGNVLSLWADKVSAEMYPKGFVKVGVEKCIWPRQLLEFSERIERFTIKEDDIWVIGYPKCGTTWCQEMIGLIVTASAAGTPKHELSPLQWKGTTYFERTSLYAKKATEGMNSFEKTEKQGSPRVIKSHLGVSLLPKDLREHITNHGITRGPKLVFIARDPKAAALSHYHESKGIDGFSGDLDDFVNAFVQDSVIFSPFWALTKSYWNIRDGPHVLFVKYEDMKQDLKSVIRNVAKFLGKNITALQVDRMAEQLSFDNMKNCPAVNKEDVRQNLQQVVGEGGFKFMRKGTVDSWREEMTPAQIRAIDEWTKENGIPELY